MRGYKHKERGFPPPGSVSKKLQHASVRVSKHTTCIARAKNHARMACAAPAACPNSTRWSSAGRPSSPLNYLIGVLLARTSRAVFHLADGKNGRWKVHQRPHIEKRENDAEANTSRPIFDRQSLHRSMSHFFQFKQQVNCLTKRT